MRLGQARWRALRLSRTLPAVGRKRWQEMRKRRKWGSHRTPGATRNASRKVLPTRMACMPSLTCDTLLTTRSQQPMSGKNGIPYPAALLYFVLYREKHLLPSFSLPPLFASLEGGGVRAMVRSRHGCRMRDEEEEERNVVIIIFHYHPGDSDVFKRIFHQHRNTL